MTKQNWAKGRKTFHKVVAIDEEVHDLLKELAHDHRLQLKEMVSVALNAYATPYYESKRNNLRGFP
jgi:hypothetical protein